MELNYTIHGLKATFLSWGPQLHGKVSDDQQLQQGHHQDPRQSLRLYGRDSVWGALAFQKQVVREVQQGFRPQIAQHRGGQAPLKEPQVSLEYFRKELPLYKFDWFKFDSPTSSLQPQPIDTVMSSSESSSDSDSSASSESPRITAPKKAKVQKPTSSAPDECVMGEYRSVIHAMVVATDDCAWRPLYAGARFRAACGRNMTEKETRFLSEWTSSPACASTPDAARSGIRSTRPDVRYELGRSKKALFSFECLLQSFCDFVSIQAVHTTHESHWIQSCLGISRVVTGLMHVLAWSCFTTFIHYRQLYNDRL